MILRRTGIAALVVSLGAGIASNLLFLAAFQFRLDMLLQPTLILGSGAIPAELLRWAAVLDPFGYYLATAVLAYVLWRQLRPRNLLIADLSTMAAVGYALAGGVGAAVLALVAPHVDARLHPCHGRPSGIDRGPVRDVLQVVWRAIWQFLDAILLAAWSPPGGWQTDTADSRTFSIAPHRLVLDDRHAVRNWGRPPKVLFEPTAAPVVEGHSSRLNRDRAS